MMMPKLLEVLYSVPVLVTVNTGSRTVDRVVVCDEDAVLREPLVVYADGERVELAQLAEAAVAIAEDADWPQWEIGA